MSDRVEYQGKGFGLVDDKGRVAIPSSLRNALAKNAPRADGKDGGTVIIAPHPDHRCLVGYDPAFVPQWRAILRDIEPAKMDEETKKRAKVLARSGAAEPLPFDGSGRFVLTSFERRYARLEGPAVFHGDLDWFTIWNPKVLLESDGVDTFLREYVEFTCEEKGIVL